MVDLGKIYEAIRDVLANDPDLMSALKGEGAKSKIFIGREMPAVFVAPAVQIVGLTDTLTEPGDYSNIVFRINIYWGANINGTVPYEKLHYALNRVYDLLAIYQFDISGVRVFALFPETRDADAVRDFDYKEEPGRFLMGIEWRIMAA